LSSLLTAFVTLFPYTTLFRSGLHREAPEPHRGADAVGHLAIDAVLVDLDLGDPTRGPDGEAHHDLPFEGRVALELLLVAGLDGADRKSTRLNSSHVKISYAVF